MTPQAFLSRRPGSRPFQGPAAGTPTAFSLRAARARRGLASRGFSGSCDSPLVVQRPEAATPSFASAGPESYKRGERH